MGAAEVGRLTREARGLGGAQGARAACVARPRAQGAYAPHPGHDGLHLERPAPTDEGKTDLSGETGRRGGAGEAGSAG